MFHPLADSIYTFAEVLGLSDPLKALLMVLTILLEALLLYLLVARRWRNALINSLIMNAVSAYLAWFFWLLVPISFITSTEGYTMLGSPSMVPVEFLRNVFIGSLILSLLIESFFMLYWWLGIWKEPEGEGVTLWRVFGGLVVANVASYMFLWGPAVLIVQLIRISHH